MLFTLQFPISDVRGFIESDTFQLPVPNWLTPLPDKDFVRSFGAVRRRRRGGLSGWVGESVVCEANSAIRFEGHTKFPLDRHVKIRIAFRRFYFDALAVGKLEVGLAVWGDSFQEYSREMAAQLISFILNLPVSLTDPLGTRTECRLFEAAPAVARLLALSTTRSSVLNSCLDCLEDWWVQACTPIIMLSHNLSSESLPLPYWGKFLQTNAIEGQIAHYFVPHESTRLRMWRLGEWWPTSSFRDLRILLLRLHAERSCLWRVLRLLALGILKVTPRGVKSDELQLYLKLATRRISQTSKQSDSRARTEIASVASEAEDMIDPGEVEMLIRTLEHLEVRGNILRNVETLTQTQMVIEELIMGNKYNVGQAGAVGDGSSAHDNTFQLIWNQSSSEIDLPTLAEELSKLRIEAKGIAETLEQDVVIGELASAEVAASNGDGIKTMEHLRKAGKWALDLAAEVGATVAAAAITAALGL